MERFKIWISVFILTGTVIFSSCNSRTFHTVTIAIDDACNLEQQSIAYEVINRRIASVWNVKEKTDLIDGKFNITYSGENALLERILTQRGEIYIAEVFQWNEIHLALDSVLERLNLPWFRERGWVTTSVAPPVLMGVHRLIQVQIDSIFNTYLHFFPTGTSLAWTAQPNMFGFYELLALKPTSRPFLLNPISVYSCEVSEFKGMPEIWIELEENYINELARFTRNNTGRNVAIAMDGKVLSYPMIPDEITSGGIHITAGDNLEIDDLLLIKSVILSGTLECKARIVN